MLARFGLELASHPQQPSRTPGATRATSLGRTLEAREALGRLRSIFFFDTKAVSSPAKPSRRALQPCEVSLRPLAKATGQNAQSRRDAQPHLVRQL